MNFRFSIKGPGFWNLPNTITVVRIVLVPVLVWLLMNEPTPLEDIIAFTIFVGAMLSDILDGYYARKLGLSTIFGAFLDPLADKLLVASVMVMLIPLGRIPAWMVALFLIRELTITAMRAVAADEGLIIAASNLGKRKTAFQLTALSFLIWHYPTLGFDLHAVGVVLLWFALYYTMVSGWDYLRSFFRLVIVAD